MTKRLRVIDEFGLPWIFLTDDELYSRLNKTKLKDLACWRDHLFLDFAPYCLEEAKERLVNITTECLQSAVPNAELLNELQHASEAYTLLWRLNELGGGLETTDDSLVTEDNGDTGEDQLPEISRLRLDTPHEADEDSGFE